MLIYEKIEYYNISYSKISLLNNPAKINKNTSKNFVERSFTEKNDAKYLQMTYYAKNNEYNIYSCI